MSAVTQFKRIDNTLLIKGKISVHNVNTLLEDYKELFNGEINNIDCGHIEEADSSAISFLLACLRQAHKRNIELNIMGMGEQLLNLASLYGVEQLLEEHSS